MRLRGGAYGDNEYAQRACGGRRARRSSASLRGRGPLRRVVAADAADEGGVFFGRVGRLEHRCVCVLNVCWRIVAQRSLRHRVFALARNVAVTPVRNDSASLRP